MFGNFSLPELLIVGALALIIIGPKDLPRMMRQVGRFVGQAKGLARQFQDSMNDAAREADLEEFREARKLLKGGKSGVTDLLNEKLEVDGNGEPVEKPAKPKNPVLSSDEMKKRADESGFGAGKAETDTAEAPDTPPTELSAIAEASPSDGAAENARTADVKSG